MFAFISLSVTAIAFYLMFRDVTFRRRTPEEKKIYSDLIYKSYQLKAYKKDAGISEKRHPNLSRAQDNVYPIRLTNYLSKQELALFKDWERRGYDFDHMWAIVEMVQDRKNKKL